MVDLCVWLIKVKKYICDDEFVLKSVDDSIVSGLLNSNCQSCGGIFINQSIHIVTVMSSMGTNTNLNHTLKGTDFTGCHIKSMLGDLSQMHLLDMLNRNHTKVCYGISFFCR